MRGRPDAGRAPRRCRCPPRRTGVGLRAIRRNATDTGGQRPRRHKASVCSRSETTRPDAALSFLVQALPSLETRSVQRRDHSGEAVEIRAKEAFYSAPCCRGTTKLQEKFTCARLIASAFQGDLTWQTSKEGVVDVPKAEIGSGGWESDAEADSSYWRTFGAARLCNFMPEWKSDGFSRTKMHEIRPQTGFVRFAEWRTGHP
jgi:hypothetical protein